MFLVFLIIIFQEIFKPVRPIGTFAKQKVLVPIGRTPVIQKLTHSEILTYK